MRLPIVLSDLMQRLYTEIRRISVSERLKSILSRLTLDLSIPGGISLEFGSERVAWSALHDYVSAYVRAWKSMEKEVQAVVFLVDDASSLLARETEATFLRAFIQELVIAKTKYLFVFTMLPAAMKLGAMYEPFGRITSGIIELSPFSEYEVHEMVREYLKGTLFDIEDNAMRLVYKYSGGDPLYVQLLMYYLYETAVSKHKKAITSEDMRDAVDAALPRVRYYLEGTIRRLSSGERRLMRAAAQISLDTPEGTMKLSSLAKALKEPRSKVAVYLSRLSSKGLISRVDRGTYRMNDPLVGLLLSREPLP